MDPFADAKSTLTRIFDLFNCTKCSKSPDDVWMLSCQHKYCKSCFDTLTLRDGKLRKCVLCSRITSPDTYYSTPDQFSTNFLRNLRKDKYVAQFLHHEKSVEGKNHSPTVRSHEISERSPVPPDPTEIALIPSHPKILPKEKPLSRSKSKSVSSKQINSAIPAAASSSTSSDSASNNNPSALDAAVPLVEISTIPTRVGTVSRKNTVFSKKSATASATRSQTNSAVSIRSSSKPSLVDSIAANTNDVTVESDTLVEIASTPANRPVLSKKKLFSGVKSSQTNSKRKRTQLDDLDSVAVSTTSVVSNVSIQEPGSSKLTTPPIKIGSIPLPLSGSKKQAVSSVTFSESLPSSTKSRNVSVVSSTSSQSPSHSAINRKNAKGETPLHVAARAGQIDKVNQLLDMSAAVNAQDHAGWTPLHEAITGKTMNALTIVDLLLSKGSQVNIIGGYGHTPLHEAARIGNVEMVKLLLSYGASNEIKNDNELSPADVAKTRETLEAIQLYKGPYKRKLNDVSALSILRLKENKILVFFTYHVDPKFLKKLSTCFKLKVVSTFSRDVTHVIFDVEPNNLVPLSLNYVYGMLTGAWLLSKEWLTASVSGENLLEVNRFEIGGYTKCSSRDLAGLALVEGSSEAQERCRVNRERKNPGLFNGLSFFIYKNSGYNFGELKITKAELSVCIRLGDGQVLNREPNPSMVDPMDNPVRFHIKEPSHSLVLTSHLILFGDDNEPLKKHNFEHVKTLRVDWLIESGLNFKLCEPKPFL